jgi:hypothetical protein
MVEEISLRSGGATEEMIAAAVKASGELQEPARGDAGHVEAPSAEGHPDRQNMTSQAAFSSNP